MCNIIIKYLILFTICILTMIWLFLFLVGIKLDVKLYDNFLLYSSKPVFVFPKSILILISCSNVLSSSFIFIFYFTSISPLYFAVYFCLKRNSFCFYNIFSHALYSYFYFYLFLYFIDAELQEWVSRELLWDWQVYNFSYFSFSHCSFKVKSPSRLL